MTITTITVTVDVGSCANCPHRDMDTMYPVCKIHPGTRDEQRQVFRANQHGLTATCPLVGETK